jgi:hypothetical protein
MPDQDSAKKIGDEPDKQSAMQSPVQLPGNESVPAASTNAATEHKESETEKLERDIRSGEKWLIGIGIASIAVNLIIAAIYYGQLGEMRKATEAATKSANVADATLKEIRQGGTDTHDLASAAKDQASAAKTGADAAKTSADNSARISKASDKSVSIAQEAMRLDQRAWVGPTKMQADIVEGKAFVFRMEIKNVGKTPALHVQAHTNPAFWNSKEKIDDTKFLAWIPGAEQLLQPGQENDITVTFDQLILTPERIAALKSGQMWIWVRTEIRYSDSFKERHNTTFCGIVNRVDLKSLEACPPGYQEAN